MFESAVRPVTWTKERQLIGAILAADWSAKAKRSWDRTLFLGIDWTKIPNLAWQYKLRPMMAAALREAGWPNVPPDIRVEVESAERQCARKAIWQLKLLAALTTAAEQRTIRVIALKGVTLSLYLYGDPFIREAFDLDLLVHPDDSARFEEVLQAQGCAPLSQGTPLTLRQMAILQQVHHDKKFRHAESGLVVESHHLLDRNLHLIGTNFGALWQARAQVPLADGSVAILGGEDLLHSLGIHASHHGWERWKWIADLAALYRRTNDADLSRQRERAAREGNQNLFDSWLLLTSAVTGMALPQMALNQAARNKRARALAQGAFRLSSREHTPGTIADRRNMLRQAAYRFGLKRSPRYIAFELVCLFHRDGDWYALRLPDRLIWVYYLVRPISIVWRIASALFQRRSKEP